MAAKLNSMRLLEQHKIPYEVYEYDDTIRNAEEVADAIGMERHMVYKTLVVQIPQEKKPVLAMIAAQCQLDLKKLAKAAGVKKAQMASFDEAERLTGLKVGGISALALVQKGWTVFLDSRAMELEQIVISAGQKGLQIEVGRQALVDLLDIQVADIGNCE